jgi:hypothetical protein
VVDELGNVVKNDPGPWPTDDDLEHTAGLTAITGTQTIQHGSGTAGFTFARGSSVTLD